jgi:uncharacterized damage-inducible protein DinB
MNSIYACASGFCRCLPGRTGSLRFPWRVRDPARIYPPSACPGVGRMAAAFRRIALGYVALVDGRDVLLELFGRQPELVRTAVEGLSADELRQAPASGANPVGWLVWHLTRVQDHHVSELAGTGQVWVEDGWADRFGLSADPDDHGYGHTPAQVAAVRPESWQALVDYHAAVLERTGKFVRGLRAEDLDEVVDTRWDPPVTRGVRLASVADDDLQHLGQAAYARGLIRSS